MVGSTGRSAETWEGQIHRERAVRAGPQFCFHRHPNRTLPEAPGALALGPDQFTLVVSLDLWSWTFSLWTELRYRELSPRANAYSVVKPPQF